MVTIIQDRPIQECPLWNTSEGVRATYRAGTSAYQVDASPRAGGAYVIPLALVDSHIIHMNDRQKARLTSWLIDRRLQGDLQPTVTMQAIENSRNGNDLSAGDRADRLLRYIAQRSESVALRVDVTEETLDAFAWSESAIWEEIDYFLDYLTEMGWIDGSRFGHGNFLGTVTVSGYSRIAEIKINPSSTQAFVAMWFNDNMAQAYEEGLATGIRDAGFDPLRIDRKEHLNRIEDEIIAEIRRSRFVVADFTHDKSGARGGVYYEAGFAHGLGLPVVFTCHKDSLETLHFDTSHFSHIVWNEPEDLREQLRNRIRAVIGHGPEITNGA